MRRIFAVKGRPADHPLIVHLAAAADWRTWGRPDPRAEALAAAFWPGPLTLILTRQERVIDEVTGGRDTVGLRMPDHPMAQALLSAFEGGIAAPSANRFGRVSPTTAAHVIEELGDEALVLDGGPCAVGLESTIIDLSGEEAGLLRPGGLSREEIEAVIGPVREGGSTAAPGTLPAHYAPRTSLRVVDDVPAEVARLSAQGLSVAALPAAAPEDYARRLYAELRRLDNLAVDVLVAARLPEAGLGRAINDRLARAARGSGGGAPT